MPCEDCEYDDELAYENGYEAGYADAKNKINNRALIETLYHLVADEIYNGKFPLDPAIFLVLNELFHRTLDKKILSP